MAQLFWLNLKIGAFTFGGGWSMITQLEQELISKRQWLSKEDLLDFISIGRSMPGIMIINISVILGYNFGGVLCAILSGVAIALPSLITMTVVTVFYTKIHNNPYIMKAMNGVRAAVIPIILNALLTLRKSAITEKICYLIVLAAFILSYFTSINNIFIILIGAAFGLVIKGREKA